MMAGKLRVADLLRCTALVVLVLVLHGSVLHSEWRGDDALQVVVVPEHSWWKYWFFPSEYFANGWFFTPWLLALYKAAIALTGNSPLGAYLIALCLMVAVACATYVFTKRVSNGWWAFWATALFVISAPAMATVSYFAVQHYTIGLLFSILAVQFHLRAVVQARPYWTAAAGIAYLLAMLAKEVYVPLILLFAVLGQEPLGARLRRIAFYGVLTVVYVVWRSRMLSSVIGGYYDALPRLFTFPAAVLELPWAALGRPGVISIAAVALVLLALLLVILNAQATTRLQIAATVACVLAMLVAPFAALAPNPQVFSPELHVFVDFRFYILSTWVLCVGAAWTFCRLRRGRLWLGVAGVLLMSLAVAQFSWVYRPHLAGQLAEYDEQMRLLRQGGPKDAILPVGDFQHAARWLARVDSAYNIRSESQAPAVVTSEEELAALFREGRRWWRYEPSCRCMRELAPDLHQLGRIVATTSPPQPRHDAVALFVDMQVRNRMVTWLIEPRAGFFQAELKGPAWRDRLPIQPQGRAVMYEAGDYVTIIRTTAEGLQNATVPLKAPREGERVLWNHGVFVEPGLAPRFTGPWQDGGRCALDFPFAKGAAEVAVFRGSSFAISGSAEAPDRHTLDALALALASPDVVRVAELASAVSPPAAGENPASGLRFAVADAQLNGIPAGDYSVSVLLRAGSVVWRCATTNTLKVRP